MSGILKYFHVKQKQSSTTRAESEINLPEPSDPLSKVIPSSTIAKVNEKVSSVIEKTVAANRGLNLHLTATHAEVPGRQESH